MIAVGLDIDARSYLEESREGRFFSVYVESEGVNVYITDATGLERYQSGQAFRHYGPGAIQGIYSEILQLPNAGPWHLIFENPADRTVHVSYNVT